MDNTEDSVPSLARLQHWNNLWDTDNYFDGYRAQEAALEWLFKTYPTNTDLNQVLIKVVALDVFYSTRIYHPTETAQHICELKDFDKRVKAGDLSLVTDVAVFKVKVKHDIKRKNIVKKKKGKTSRKTFSPLPPSIALGTIPKPILEVPQFFLAASRSKLDFSGSLPPIKTGCC